jgi:hypothetical protein
MEITTLTASIAPFLPFLLNLDNKTSESAAFSKAQAIWEILGSKVAAKEAAIDLAKNPNDKDLQVTLRVQLKKLLDQDAELSKSIEQILQAKNPQSNTPEKIQQNHRKQQSSNFNSIWRQCLW